MEITEIHDNVGGKSEICRFAAQRDMNISRIHPVRSIEDAVDRADLQISASRANLKYGQICQSGRLARFADLPISAT